MQEPVRFHDATLIRIRQVVRSDGAALPVAREKGRDRRLRCEFFRLVFPSLVRDVCGPRGSSEYTQRAGVSGDGRHNCDDVIQEITPATPYPTLCHSILPRTFERSADRIHPQGSNRCGDFQSILGITIKEDEPRSGSKWKGFSQLLDDPQLPRWTSSRFRRLPS
jgi:hypothetical protein